MLLLNLCFAYYVLVAVEVLVYVGSVLFGSLFCYLFAPIWACLLLVVVMFYSSYRLIVLWPIIFGYVWYY